MMLAIEADFEWAKDATCDALRRNSTSVTIGQSAFVSPSFRGEIRSTLNGKFAYLQVQFRTVFASELVSSVSSRMIELELTFTPFENGGAWNKYLCAQNDCPWPYLKAVTLIGNPAVTLADLKSYPLIVACSERAYPILYGRLIEECRAGQTLGLMGGEECS